MPMTMRWSQWISRATTDALYWHYVFKPLVYKLDFVIRTRKAFAKVRNLVLTRRRRNYDRADVGDETDINGDPRIPLVVGDDTAVEFDLARPGGSQESIHGSRWKRLRRKWWNETEEC